MLWPTRHITSHTTTWDSGGTSTTTPNYVYETDMSTAEEHIIRVKHKVKPRRYYCYSIDNIRSIVIAARSASEADRYRAFIVKATNGKWPHRTGVEHTAKRVRTVYTGYKGKMMGTMYGVFLLKNVTRNRRKVILDLP